MKNEGRSFRAFLTSRWRGDVPLRVIFFRDMLLVGTAINVGTAFVALLLLSLDVPAGLALALFLAPLPYNFLLYIGVWTAAAQAAAPRATMVRLVATGWVIASLLI